MPTTDFSIGDMIRLNVIEPRGHSDARVEHPGNYVPVSYVGLVERARQTGPVSVLDVRWNLPASYGYKTFEGTISTLLHVANGVYVEARKRPRNVLISAIEKITEDEYKRMINEAART